MSKNKKQIIDESAVFSEDLIKMKQMKFVESIGLNLKDLKEMLILHSIDWNKTISKFPFETLIDAMGWEKTKTASEKKS